MEEKKKEKETNLIATFRKRKRKITTGIPSSPIKYSQKPFLNTLEKLMNICH